MTDPGTTSGAWAKSKGVAHVSVVPLVSLMLFAVVLPEGEAKAGAYPPRVQIPGFVQVEGETVRLSDLLPPDAPEEFGEIGARVILGESPLPASPRVILKAQIERKLREVPSLLERLEIPDRLIVTRPRRRLSSAEIWTAIEDFLAERGLPAPVPQACMVSSADGPTLMNAEAAEPGKQHCAQGGLGLQAPVFVTQLDPGLAVKSMEPDRVRRRLRFLLWTAHEPQVLPFYVNVEKLWSAAAWSSQPLRSMRPAHSPAVVLVAAGKPARLVIETPNLRLTARVSPLESGVKGQVIRVRNLDTQRILEAQVVGVGLLQAELAANDE